MEFFSVERFKKHDTDHRLGGQNCIFRVSLVIGNEYSLDFFETLTTKKFATEHRKPNNFSQNDLKTILTDFQFLCFGKKKSISLLHCGRDNLGISACTLHPPSPPTFDC